MPLEGRGGGRGETFDESAAKLTINVTKVSYKKEFSSQADPISKGACPGEDISGIISSGWAMVEWAKSLSYQPPFEA